MLRDKHSADRYQHYSIFYFFFFTGSYVLAWKRGIAVLTAGPVKVSPDPRVRLLSTPQSTSPLPGLSGGGYSLELRDVRPQDAGDYICQIGTFEPREITHTLEILGKHLCFIYYYNNFRTKVHTDSMYF